MKCKFDQLRRRLTLVFRGLAFGTLQASLSCVSSRLEGSIERVQIAAADQLRAEVTSTQTAEARLMVNDRVASLLAEPLTAESAVQIALLRNQRLQADLALLGIAQADLVQAGLFKNPVFSGTLRWAPGSQRTFDFEIAQDFLNIVLTPLRVSVAEKELEAVEQQVIRSIIQLALKTRQAVIRYQSALQQVELWESVLEAQEASYELALRMGESGNLNNVEVTNERVLLEQSRIDATAAAMREGTERERVNQLLGLWGTNTNWTTDPRLPELPEQWGTDPEIEQTVVAASRELKTGQARLEAAAKRVGLEQILQALPMIEIGGSVEAEKERGPTLVRRQRLNREKLELGDDVEPVEWWGGPSLTVPIPIFDLGHAAKARALAELQRMWDQLTAHAVELRAVPSTRAIEQQFPINRPSIIEMSSCRYVTN
jgi:cobalt-zinc-cadmium efflux system outer membrane protein